MLHQPAKVVLEAGEGHSALQDGDTCEFDLEWLGDLPEHLASTFPSGCHPNYLVGWHLCDPSLAHIDRSLLGMKLNEKSQFTLHNNPDLNYSIKITSLIKFPLFWKVSVDIVIERVKLYKDRASTLFNDASQLDKALHFYSKALKILTLWVVFCVETNPEVDQLFKLLYNNIAFCQLKCGGDEFVIINCTKCLDMLGPDSNDIPIKAKALYRRGCAQMNLHNMEEAMDDLKSAAQLEPNNSAIHKQLTLVKKEISDCEQRLKQNLKKLF